MERKSLYNKELEESLIGSVLIDPNNLLLSDIEPEDIYFHRYKYIWEAFLRLQKKGVGIDLITVSDELKEVGRLEDVGGSAGITQIITATPSSLGVDNYNKLIKGYSTKRKLIEVANSIARNVYGTNTEVDDIVGNAIMALTQTAITKEETVQLSEVVSELYDDVLERSKDPQDIWGMETGLTDLDYMLGGIEKGLMLILAGEPGAGKSILANQICYNFATQGHAGILYSMEMRAKRVAMRTISAIGKFPTRHMKSGRMTPEDWSSMAHAVKVSEHVPFYINHSSGITTAQLRADITRQKQTHNIEWIIIDYLLLMKDKRGELKEAERTAYLSGILLEIIGEFNIAGIVISSVVKSAMQGGSPVQSDVRGSGETIHAADNILFISPHQPDSMETFDQNIRTLTITKGRDLDVGVGSIDIMKFTEYPLFENLADDYF